MAHKILQVCCVVYIQYLFYGCDCVYRWGLPINAKRDLPVHLLVLRFRLHYNFRLHHMQTQLTATSWLQIIEPQSVSDPLWFISTFGVSGLLILYCSNPMRSVDLSMSLCLLDRVYMCVFTLLSSVIYCFVYYLWVGHNYCYAYLAGFTALFLLPGETTIRDSKLDR